MLSDARFSCLQAWFDTFVQSFPQDDADLAFNISLKIDHTARVVGLMRAVAASEGLDMHVAAACALFHDVGRFPQYLQFRTFVDARSINHACLSLDTLREHSVLQGLHEATVQIIEDAVLHHNKAQLPPDLHPFVLPYARALRDADKLDILSILCEHYEHPSVNGQGIELGLPDTGTVSDVVLDAVAAGRTVLHHELQSVDDFKLLQMGWLHDLNTQCARSIFRERQYLERIRRALPSDHAGIDALYGQLRDELEE